MGINFRRETREERIKRLNTYPSYWCENNLNIFKLRDYQREILDASRNIKLLNTSRRGGKSYLCAISAVHEAVRNSKSVLVISSVSLSNYNLGFEIHKILRDSGIKHIVSNASIIIEDTEISLASNCSHIRGRTSKHVIIDDITNLPMSTGDAALALILDQKDTTFLATGSYSNSTDLYRYIEDNGKIIEGKVTYNGNR